MRFNNIVINVHIKKHINIKNSVNKEANIQINNLVNSDKKTFSMNIRIEIRLITNDNIKIIKTNIWELLFCRGPTRTPAKSG